MRSPSHRLRARAVASIAGALALVAAGITPAAATPEAFLTPIMPAQMEVGERLPLRLVICFGGSIPSTTAEEATEQEAARELEEQRRNAEAEARDPRGRLGPESYDPIGFTESGQPIWPALSDPADNPFRIEVRTPDPPNCTGVPGTWRLRSDNISLETTSNYGDATLRALAPGVGKFRVRHDIERLPSEWLDFRVKVVKKNKKTPFEQLYGDAFKVARVDLVPHETRAATGEPVIGVALECDKKDRCRPAKGKVSVEHDNDGDITADTVAVALGFFGFTTGEGEGFDVPRVTVRKAVEFASLSVESAAREGRQRGDANGIAGGIDQDDVFWLWVRRGMTSIDEGWDPWMDLTDDGVYDMFDIAVANSRSVANGNGSFDASRYGYDPAAPETSTEGAAATTTDEGTRDRVAVLSTIPAWKLLQVERERHAE